MTVIRDGNLKVQLSTEQLHDFKGEESIEYINL